MNSKQNEQWNRDNDENEQLLLWSKGTISENESFTGINDQIRESNEDTENKK